MHIHLFRIFYLISLGLVLLHSLASTAQESSPNNINPIIQIPKIIHYVWLGSSEPPPKAKEYIASWQKHHPDFIIKEWNEKNCDIKKNPFVKGAYKKKRYDFASDYCRIIALKEGGIYLDTDMLLKGSLNSILDTPLVLTLEDKEQLSGSFMAITPNHPFIMALYADYENRSEFNDSMPYNAPQTWTRIFKEVFKNPISINKKKEYHIINPNILMYDFGGNENLAEHLYTNGSKDLQQSKWYNHFRNVYLKQFAFHIPAENKYFIIQNERKGYFYNPDNRKSSSQINYQFQNNALEIQEDNKKRSFLCSNQICK